MLFILIRIYVLGLNILMPQLEFITINEEIKE
jgi:hypothetical protein